MLLEEGVDLAPREVDEELVTGLYPPGVDPASLLLHKNIDSVEKKLLGPGGTLTLKCKNFTQLKLEFSSAEDCLNVASSIEQLSNIDDITLFYPFFYRAMFEPLEDGWQMFKPETEYARFKECSEEWRLSYSVMMRSSQPLTGQSNKRCKEDEKLVNSVLGIGKRGYIVDTRSQSNAKAAQSKGGGYEPEAHYSQWRRIHQAVERRQVLPC
ncbi:hypothetical protein KUTeg_000492 [Tegillarca granosa]|uniref:Myotubularin phosphatase domain-containing protein n=1 Tax=Tegillarca granosa TaxID=220873 RepID=A0ABQ9FZ25_TEGGR|nr:hypothetical protein KUTeg_000492 [Tegillarca granosa]